MNTFGQSNIDDVRAEIMRLENETVFDQRAWAKVLADLEAAGRVSALADARRRMKTAKQNAKVVLEKIPWEEVDLASLHGGVVRVAVETDKERRLRYANALLKVIATCGRQFFHHNERISRFELDARGRVWFVDAYREARIYTHYVLGRWRGFSEGGTLRDLVIRLRDFITKGTTVGRVFGPYPDWYCDGDPWGYGADMKRVFDAAVEMGIVEVSYRIATMATVEA